MCREIVISVSLNAAGGVQLRICHKTLATTESISNKGGARHQRLNCKTLTKLGKLNNEAKIKVNAKLCVVVSKKKMGKATMKTT